MPQLLEETTVSLERFDLHSRSPISRPTKSGRLVEPKRTKGIHLSGVLKYILIESGILKNWRDQLEEEELPLRMALGLAWEEFAASLYPEIYWQPGETSADGIVMTCDGHNTYQMEDNEVLGLEEFKLTWKKAKTGEELINDQWYWMQQARGYCWGYDARIVRWHICFVNGDYRGSGPIYKRYVVLFTDKDVESTRRMILNNTTRAIEKGYCE